MPKNLQTRIRDLSESIRFMSKAERRRVYYATGAITSLTSTGLYLGFHTVYIDNVMQTLQMYKSKMGVPVDVTLNTLLERTLQDIEDAGDSSVGLFNFVGNEVYSIGSLHLPNGAYIGVPIYFNFTDVSQLNAGDIRLLGQYRTKRTTNAPVIKRLFDSMILSEQAKQYALAHQLNFLSSSYVLVKSANIFLCTLGSFVLANVLNQKLGFVASKKRLPRILCGLMCFLSITVITGAVLDQLLDEWYDIRALRQTLKLAKAKPEYQIGAIEYYQKLIERNKAMYEMLGDHASHYFTEDGQTRRVFGLLKQSYEKNLALATMANVASSE